MANIEDRVKEIIVEQLGVSEDQVKDEAKFVEDPAKLSGLGIVSRVDYGTNFPAQLAEFFMDVNVS